MKNIEISDEKLNKIKNITIFILLLSWILIPVFKSFFLTFRLVSKHDYTLMKIIGLFGIYLLAYYLYRKIKTEKNKKEIIKVFLPIIIFLLYMIWTLIACCMSPNKELAFYGNEYRQEGYITYITYAGFFFCAFLLDSKKLRKILLNIFVLVSVFLLLASRIWSQFTGMIGIFMVNSPTQSVFGQFNHYGYYLLISLMCTFSLFIDEKNKILKVFYLIAYILIGYNLILNNTFGCYLSVSIILIAYLIYSLIKKKNRILTLIAIVIFVILSCIVTENNESIALKNVKSLVFDAKAIASKITNINYNSDEEIDYSNEEEVTIQKEQIEKNFKFAGTSRMILWKYGIQFIKESPIIGYGPENLGDKYRGKGWNQDRPHNLLIQLATTSGIPGMILYITAVGIIIVRGIKKLKTENKMITLLLLVIITYLISAMFGNSMYYTSPYFFIFLGFLMNCNICKEKN